LIVNSALSSAAMEAPPAPGPSGRVATGRYAPGTGTDHRHGSPQDISIDSIAPNPYQPRREFDPQQIAELTQSILQQGILQPLIVSSAPATAEKPFVLIAGERRLRAARQAGLASVPCIVKQATPEQMIEWALIENIQRTDLNPIERAIAYQNYLQRFNLTQSQGAQKLGEPRATIANYLRILELHPDIQKMLATGQISFGHAKVIAALPDGDKQLELARRAANSSLSVRHIEQLVQSAQTSSAGADAPSAPTRPKAPYIRDVEEQLSQAVGTRVIVLPGRSKNTGRMVLEYYNLDDFDRISGLLGLKVSS
jgi:ParB family chromosome partitioning protein